MPEFGLILWETKMRETKSLLGRMGNMARSWLKRGERREARERVRALRGRPDVGWEELRDIALLPGCERADLEELAYRAWRDRFTREQRMAVFKAAYEAPAGRDSPLLRDMAAGVGEAER